MMLDTQHKNNDSMVEVPDVATVYVSALENNSLCDWAAIIINGSKMICWLDGLLKAHAQCV